MYTRLTNYGTAVCQRGACMNQIHKKLDRITEACGEIRQALNEHLHATTNSKYKTDIGASKNASHEKGT